jgi:hypothetical protein
VSYRPWLAQDAKAPRGSLSPENNQAVGPKKLRQDGIFWAELGLLTTTHYAEESWSPPLTKATNICYGRCLTLHGGVMDFSYVTGL